MLGDENHARREAVHNAGYFAVGVAYEALYLRGVEQFNRGNYFASHELWEALWMEHEGPSKLFYKGLIQAAVALYHFENGNFHGARKLKVGSHRYLEPYGSKHLGVDIVAFLEQFDRCLAPAWSADEAAATRMSDVGPPCICLDPPPEDRAAAGGH